MLKHEGQADPSLGHAGPTLRDGLAQRLLHSRADRALDAAGIIAFDADLRIISWSRTAEALTGTRAEQAIGRHLNEIIRDWNPEGSNGEQGGVPSLTRRQHQVLKLLAEGVPAKVIASDLAVAAPTVRNHIRAILHHLNAHSQLEAVAKARRLGLI